MTAEEVNYIISHYSDLLNLNEKRALKHHRSSLKLQDMPDGEIRRQLYLRNNWLTDDPEILNYLSEGYVQFIITTAENVLKNHPGKMFFNRCKICGKLARTPLANQCRFCGHDWH
ncbi:hypothetical protein MTO98_21545 [Mucilaginibacter sp. SMC90]|uniref:hypothetical protein n=1 Tax=Mucilaginibacter sp. SMC90 TaxID=2929803 RepID=UPI001FB41B26|nr:hypothetical protein [Mucilaginibacter sp. SMC90]UOE46993.1 hypothetical protein MTO98_21545 [Mucilaginibacter sp. SMC90]